MFISIRYNSYWFKLIYAKSLINANTTVDFLNKSILVGRFIEKECDFELQIKSSERIEKDQYLPLNLDFANVVTRNAIPEVDGPKIRLRPGVYSEIEVGYRSIQPCLFTGGGGEVSKDGIFFYKFYPPARVYPDASGNRATIYGGGCKFEFSAE